ncbi:MAG: bacteriorhodopsin [Opitutales bacterium]
MDLSAITFLAQTGGGLADLGNMENYFQYSNIQWESVSHVLTLGVGVFIAALVYFLASMKQVAPRFRLSNMLSAVVMVSAAVILFRQAFDWDSTFRALGNGMYGRKDGELFSNGYRYMNWSIDVPVLLVQMLIILPLAHKVKTSRGWQFVIAGLIMIWTSWAAQFYEHGAQVEGVSVTPFWIWYLLGWLAYIWIVAIVWKTISDGKKDPSMSADSKNMLGAIRWVLVGSWTAYAVAIVLPLLWWDAGSGVARQFIFTFADIISKAIYGVMLGMVAANRSKQEDGFLEYPDEQWAIRENAKAKPAAV